MASTEGAKPVGQPGLTAGNCWTGIQEITPRLALVNCINLTVRKFTRSDYKKIATKKKLLIHVIQIKIMTIIYWTLTLKHRLLENYCISAPSSLMNIICYTFSQNCVKMRQKVLLKIHLYTPTQFFLFLLLSQVYLF